MSNTEFEHAVISRGHDAENKKGFLITLISLVLLASVIIGAAVSYAFAGRGIAALVIAAAVAMAIPLMATVIYRKLIQPYYRRLEDANLELRIKQEELLDTKDDLFIKFLGIYDANYAANSPRLFEKRLNDVADITARVMDADVCFIYLYDKKRDDLVLSATNEKYPEAVGALRIPLGEGLEGWVARRLEPLMLRDIQADTRYRELPGIPLADYPSAYCLPLYVYSNGALMGVMEILYAKARNFSDEEINFFTTLAGLLSNTIQNERLQSELRKMNMELEQWVTEKTEELRASEERYRSLVENSCESIFVLAQNGDIVFANEHAARLTGFGKFDLLHKNLLELFTVPAEFQGILTEPEQGRQSLRHGELRRADGAVVPVDVTTVVLTLMGKQFLQAVVRDMSSHARLQKLLEEKQKELVALSAKLVSRGQ